MPADLLSRISAEVEERRNALRVAVEEYERLLAAADALEAERAPASGRGRERAPDARRAPASGAPPERAAGQQGARGARRPAAPSSSRKPRDQAGARGRARVPSPQQEATARAIVAALEHGSHTVGELVLVSAIPVADIREGVRRLRAAGRIVPTEREGRTAYALSAAAA
ncbi:MAG TPA: hypothetical protein VL979_10730 [Solirubrobacteraceae bacterium]|nr:hypothetical protein [Solirubrobacteraceae bacterium]